ncbi:hypothetical protein [Saccharopolyspora gregorii]|uniref:Uncharacterized protein n=1 Tax=Saccharopolyspora gregorii TaxID=33914 RepID=A0ABP6RGR8_9PSEU
MTALRWAHQVQDEFSDGVLVADLGGASPTGPASPFDVLGAFLRDLGVTAVGALTTERERANLFHTLTAHRELLLVLDDAATSRQSKPCCRPRRGAAWWSPPGTRWTCWASRASSTFPWSPST